MLLKCFTEENIEIIIYFIATSKNKALARITHEESSFFYIGCKALVHKYDILLFCGLSAMR